MCESDKWAGANCNERGRTSFEVNDFNNRWKSTTRRKDKSCNFLTT
jgi:hypothetical protein